MATNLRWVSATALTNSNFGDQVGPSSEGARDRSRKPRRNPRLNPFSFRAGELAFNDYGRVSRTAMKLAPRRTFKAVSPNWNNPGFADARHPEK